MALFSILTHIGDIVAAIHEVQKWIEFAVARKNIPSASESKPVIDAFRKLLDSGVIDIKGVDEAELSKSLKILEDQLCPPEVPPQA